MNLVFVPLSQIKSKRTEDPATGQIVVNYYIDLPPSHPIFTHIFEVLHPAHGNDVKLAIVNGNSGIAKVEWVSYNFETKTGQQYGYADTLVNKLKHDVDAAFKKYGQNNISYPFRLGSVDNDEHIDTTIMALQSVNSPSGLFSLDSFLEDEKFISDLISNSSNHVSFELQDGAKTIVVKQKGQFYGRKRKFDWDANFGKAIALSAGFAPSQLQYRDLESQKEAKNNKYRMQFVKSLRLWLQFTPMEVFEGRCQIRALQQKDQSAVPGVRGLTNSFKKLTNGSSSASMVGEQLAVTQGQRQSSSSSSSTAAAGQQEGGENSNQNEEENKLQIVPQLSPAEINLQQQMQKVKNQYFEKELRKYPVDIDVVLACPRPKVVERLLQTLATFGVNKIIVFKAAKVEANYFDAKRLSEDTIEACLVEGLSQSAHYTRMPEVKVFPKTNLEMILNRRDNNTMDLEHELKQGTVLAGDASSTSTSRKSNSPKEQLDNVMADNNIIEREQNRPVKEIKIVAHPGTTNKIKTVMKQQLSVAFAEYTRKKANLEMQLQQAQEYQGEIQSQSLVNVGDCVQTPEKPTQQQQEMDNQQEAATNPQSIDVDQQTQSTTADAQNSIEGSPMSSPEIVSTPDNNTAEGEQEQQTQEQEQSASSPAESQKSQQSQQSNLQQVQQQKMIENEQTINRVKEQLDMLEKTELPRIKLTIAIGPEGGWTDEEVRALERNRFQKVCLGPRILKTHDAAVNILGLVYDSIE